LFCCTGGSDRGGGGTSAWVGGGGVMATGFGFSAHAASETRAVTAQAALKNEWLDCDISAPRN
jgi:hypothetical protein